MRADLPTSQGFTHDDEADSLVRIAKVAAVRAEFMRDNRSETGLSLARHLSRLDRFGEAIDILLSCASTDGLSFGIALELARLKRRTNSAEADHWFNRCLVLSPGTVAARMSVAGLMRQFGCDSDAAEIRRAIASEFPGIDTVFIDAGVRNMPATTTVPEWTTGPGDDAKLRVLVLLGVGRGNIEYKGLIDADTAHCVEVIADFHDPSVDLPPHDIFLNAIADADVCRTAFVNATQLADSSLAPVLNEPRHVESTGREAGMNALREVDGLVVPKVKMFTKSGAEHTQTRNELKEAGFRYPFLIRSLGQHQGENFVMVRDDAELTAAVVELPGSTLLAIEYVDVSDDLGRHRKYRCMFIDDKIYPLHLALSPDWKIHYFSSAMADNADYREQERAFLDDPVASIGNAAFGTLARVMQRLRLDYAGMDFALNGNGEVVLFEANAAMAIIPPPNTEKWRYRMPAIEAARNAFRLMLLKRLADRSTLLSRTTTPAPQL